MNLEGKEVGLCSLYVDPFFSLVSEKAGTAMRLKMTIGRQLTGWCLRFVCCNEGQLEWLAMIATGFQNPPELRVPILGAGIFFVFGNNIEE